MTLRCRMGKHSAQLSKESLQHCNVLGSCLCVYNQGMLESLGEPMDNGCEAAVASQLEPSFAYHMIRALVMAIMTAVVVGLQRGYDRLRKSHSLLPLGGSINCDTTMCFFGFISRNWCHLKPFKGIIYSCFRLQKNVAFMGEIV